MTQERRLAAIMFADVCGYSRMMDEDESRALSVLQAANSCIEQAAALFGGRIIKKLGDGALCEFPSAVNAVRAAIETQKAISEYNRTAPPERQFQMRIGIHIGDVVVADNDIFGDGVNVASRIQPLADPGGICVSRDVFDLVRNNVAIEAVNLGPHDLKNISRQVDIYKILIDAVEGGSSARRMQPSAGEGARRSRLMPAWGWIAMAAAVLVLAGLGGKAARKRRLDREAHAAAESAVAEARRLAGEGKAAEALKRLEDFPEKYKGTRGADEVIDAVKRIEEPAARQEIEKRQLGILRALHENNRQEVTRLLHPDMLRESDPLAVGMKLRFAELLLRGVEVDKDHVRISKVEFSEDRSTARVWVEILRKTPDAPEGRWEESLPFTWMKFGDEWLLRWEPRKPGNPPPDRMRPARLRREQATGD